MKNYSPAFERNHHPITESLKTALPNRGSVIEIGSGSGEHVSWFSQAFPHLRWQPTDVEKNLSSIAAWIDNPGCTNVASPIALQLGKDNWPNQSYDALICINTVHIVNWECVKSLFIYGAQHLNPGGVFFVYGPYKYKEQDLAPSNEQFDSWLKSHNPESGIRCFEDINQLALNNSLELVNDCAMPSNNHSIWWRKKSD